MATLNAAGKVNLRTPELMKLVQEKVESHYRSPVVDYLRHTKSFLSANGLTVKLAKAFGFCYGVERAINLAYASAKAYAGHNIYVLGEIIHNPEVNDQLREMGIKQLKETRGVYDLDGLTAGGRGHRPRLRRGGEGARAAQGNRLLQGRHHLRRRDERLAPRAPVPRQGHHLHHPRQGVARGDQGHRLAGHQRHGRHALPRRLHAR